MKIGIDARFLTHPQSGGFKTYTQNLIAALAQVDRENEYVLYLDRLPRGEGTIPHVPNMELKVVNGTWPPLLGMLLREQLGLVQAARRDRLDLLHCTALTAPLFPSCPLILTLHDTIWHEQQSWQKAPISARRWLMARYYRCVPEWAALKAASVITVSEAAKADIVTRLGIATENVVVTHEAAGPAFSPKRNSSQIHEVRTRFALPPDFVLAIGSADPRKNIAGLVSAYGQLPDEVRNSHHLAIVWTHHELAKEIARQVESLGLTQHCHFLSGVSNEDLAFLYNGAVLFAFPSRYEGFGLPLIEAMACGTPVAAANNSSIPEIVGDAALLFDAERPDQMAQSMACLLSDRGKRIELAQHGLRRAAKFSWARCAEETIAAYRRCSLAAGRTPNPSPVPKPEGIGSPAPPCISPLAREK